MGNEAIKLSASQVVKGDECMYQLKLYRQRVRRRATSCNLVFGQCIDEALRTYVTTAYGGSPTDPVPVFEQAWQKALASTEISFPSTWSAEELARTGIRLLELFPGVWDPLGLTPLLDDKGQPVMDVMLEAEIAPGVVLRGVLDFAGFNPAGDLVVVDYKTAAQAHDYYFARKSDQLTAYQLLLTLNQQSLGPDPVKALAFLDLVKRKVSSRSNSVGPEVCTPRWVPPRSQDEVNAFKQKVIWLAEDIRARRWVQRPKMSFNSPCSQCDYKDYCLYGEKDGLVFPEDVAASLAA